MSTEWKDAPEWANWRAMDQDGWWWWYAMQPKFKPKKGRWVRAKDDRQEPELASDEPDESGINWDFAHSTLEARP